MLRLVEYRKELFNQLLASATPTFTIRHTKQAQDTREPKKTTAALFKLILKQVQRLKNTREPSSPAAPPIEAQRCATFN